ENLRKTRRRRAPALPRKSRNLSHPMVAFFIAQNSFWRKTVTREEIIAAVKECTARLGRAPGADEFRLTMSVRRHLIRKYFSTYTQLLTECGLERHGSGKALTLESIFRDWAGVVRSMGKIPTTADYDRHGVHSYRPFLTRY